MKTEFAERIRGRVNIAEIRNGLRQFWFFPVIADAEKAEWNLNRLRCQSVKMQMKEWRKSRRAERAAAKRKRSNPGESNGAGKRRFYLGLAVQDYRDTGMQGKDSMSGMTGNTEDAESERSLKSRQKCTIGGDPGKPHRIIQHGYTEHKYITRGFSPARKSEEDKHLSLPAVLLDGLICLRQVCRRMSVELEEYFPVAEETERFRFLLPC